MSLFDVELAGRRQWLQVGDAYEVTRKPRWLDTSSLAAIPFASMADIPQGGLYAPDFTLKTPPEIKSGTYFERGDILVAKITPSFENGKQALTTGLPTPFGFATTEVIPLRPHTDGHDRRLLFFYLLHPDVRHHVAERMEGTTGRQRVPEEILLDLPFPEFEREEQTAISDSLEMIQRLMVAETKSAQTASDLKHATMRSLFTHGLRGEAKKETEIGPVPESWEIVNVGTVRERLQYGTSTRCSYEPTEFPVLRIPNIEPGRVNYEDLKFGRLRATEADRYRLKNGDLIFIRTNGVVERLGACAIYTGKPENALFASYLIRACLKLDQVDPHFMAYFFESERGTSIIAGRATPAADGKYNLNTGTIDALPLSLPPTLEEQREIVAVLNAIDRKIDLHRKKRTVLNDLFKALLHKLMTGEIRIAALNLSSLPDIAPTKTKSIREVLA